MPFFPGLVAGFTGSLDAQRSRNVEEQGRIDARQNQILSLLAESDDPEIQALAISSMLDLAGPKKKQGGMAGFLREAQGAPQFAAVQRFIRAGKTETQQVPDVESQPAASLTDNFQRSAQAGSAAQPEAQPLAQAPPGDIQQILSAGGLPDTQLDRPGGLEGALGTPPPVPTTGREVNVPRTIFKSDAEKAADQQSAEMASFRAELEELGVLSEREIAEAVTTAFGGRPFAAFGGSALGRRFQRGAFALDPSRPGEGPFPVTFDTVTGEALVPDPSDPSGATKMIMPSDWLNVTSGLMTGVGDRAERLQNVIEGRGPTLLGQGPAAAESARAGAAEFETGTAVDRAGRSARATGDQQIITAQNMPLNPTALAMFPGQTGLTSLADLENRIPLTTNQRQRIFAANQVDTLIDNIEELLPRVFPEVEPGFWGVVRTQFSLAQQMLGGSADLAALDAAVETALGQVATLGGDSGRLAVDDINRARASLAKVKAEFLGGDTLQTARARIDVVRDLLLSVREQTPTTGAGAAGPAPIDAPGALATPPPTDPNVVDASSLRPAPQ